MASKLTLRYDTIGDILIVETCRPYASQESDELPDEMIGRYNPDTGELESVEVLHFSHRYPRGARGAGVTLPFLAKGPKADPPFESAKSPRRAPARARRR
jgi:hypothetical protein